MFKIINVVKIKFIKVLFCIFIFTSCKNGTIIDDENYYEILNSLFEENICVVNETINFTKFKGYDNYLKKVNDKIKRLKENSKRDDKDKIEDLHVKISIPPPPPRNYNENDFHALDVFLIGRSRSKTELDSIFIYNQFDKFPKRKINFSKLKYNTNTWEKCDWFSKMVISEPIYLNKEKTLIFIEVIGSYDISFYHDPHVFQKKNDSWIELH